MIEPECTCGEGDGWLAHPHKSWCTRHGLRVLMHYRFPDGTIACGWNNAGSNCHAQYVTCRDCLMVLAADVPAIVNRR